MIDPLQPRSCFLWIVCAGFLVDWLAVACRWRKIKPFTKPIAMLAIILWTLNAVGWEMDSFMVLLLLAQVFGLAGDIFLLFTNRWFIWGLISFLIGHLFYISLMAALIIDQIRILISGGSLWRIAVCILTWLVFLLCFYLILRPAYKKRHGSNSIWIPVQIYFWILSGLVVVSLFVVLVHPSYLWMSIVLVIGAALFLTSDVLLAVNRYINKIKHAQLWVRITYHLAQFFLAVGFLALK